MICTSRSFVASGAATALSGVHPSRLIDFDTVHYTGLPTCTYPESSFRIREILEPSAEFVNWRVLSDPRNLTDRSSISAPLCSLSRGK